MREKLKEKHCIVGIFGLIGAVLMIAGVFMTWVDYELYYTISTTTKSYTGLQVANKESILTLEYYDLPQYTLYAGVASVITCIVSVFLKPGTASRLLGVITIVIAEYIGIFMILFYQQMGSLSMAGVVSLTVKMGSGFIMSMAGVGLAFLSGIAVILTRPRAIHEI